MILPRSTASRYGRVITTSRTRPCIVYCENEEGEEIELVVKLVGGGDTGGTGLISEIIAAQLADDLGLPFPDFCLLEITREFAEAVPNLEISNFMKGSIGWNFATKKLPPSYTVVASGKQLSIPFRLMAGEIFAFDALIQNPDRRAVNPNCLTNGKELAIIDHELAFSFLRDILPTKPPWDGGNIDFVKNHLFYDALRKTTLNLDRLVGAVDALPETRINSYGECIPSEWNQGGGAAAAILDYTIQMKRHILPALEAIRAKLT